MLDDQAVRVSAVDGSSASPKLRIRLATIHQTHLTAYQSRTQWDLFFQNHVEGRKAQLLFEPRIDCGPKRFDNLPQRTHISVPICTNAWMVGHQHTEKWWLCRRQRLPFWKLRVLQGKGARDGAGRWLVLFRNYSPTSQAGGETGKFGDSRFVLAGRSLGHDRASWRMVSACPTKL